MKIKCDMDLNTRLIDLTLGDLLSVIGRIEKEEPKESVDYTGDRYVYKIAGIAKLLDCSPTMVWRHRKNGWIEPAIKQNGRKIICDAQLALELFSKRK